MYHFKHSLRWEDNIETAAVMQAAIKCWGFLKFFKMLPLQELLLLTSQEEIFSIDFVR
jgi:hypothetical protein